ncbi:MAG: hypothetical protein EOP04_22730 [Proteobacteria bacterium]|nr:MAG: hypothetical protein EOP04_22730 [Pseudomonadota bacterium]
MEKSEFLSMFAGPSEFLNLPCWLTTSGEGVGSIIGLSFGDRLPTENIIKKNGTVFNFEPSSHGLMVYCKWKFSRNFKSICDSNSSNANDGEMVTGLKQLIGNKIVNIEVDSSTLDLRIVFTNSYVLQCFCEDKGEPVEQYTLFFKDFSASVHSHGLIEIEVKAQY